MRRANNSLPGFGVLLSVALTSACSGAAPAEDSAAGLQSPATEIGLLTSLPIFWPETDNPADMLSAGEQSPWPRALIEQRHTLVPLDALQGGQGLARVQVAVLAQPRPLSAADNVALDDWVRAGGHVLVFADPALTEHSRFHLGDPRRPQDVILLSPILTRWGLTLSFDDSAEADEQLVADPVAGALPVRLAGRLTRSDAGGAGAGDCRIEAGGVVARCRIGRGSATVVADAALLETGDHDGAHDAEAALAALIDSLAAQAAGTAREKPGETGQSGVEASQTGSAQRGERD